MRTRKAMRAATAGVTAGLLAALVLVGASSDDDDAALTEVADRPGLDLGAPYPGGDGAEDSATALVTDFQAVDASPGTPCPAEDLVVSWEDPGDRFEHGARYEPVGPRPTGVETANGVVSCEGSDYDHVGFTADYQDGRWTIDLAPDFGEGHTDEADDHGDEGEPPVEVEPEEPVTPTVLSTVPTPGEDTDVPAPTGPEDLIDRLDEARIEVTDITDLRLDRTWHGVFDEHPIEDLATYEPQTLCSPVPKAGTVGFSEMVLEAFDHTGTSGIARDCSQGGRSEHKEGRAWDWTAYVDDEDDAAAASQVIGWLLATDENGNEYAMARRLGLMYVIYNQSIWRSYAPEAGWVGYTGPNPHTDHVHFSFNRSGGAGATSFWQVADLPEVDASAFGPYALLPDAGGVPTVNEVADRPDRRPNRPGPVRVPRPTPAPPTPAPLPPPPAPAPTPTLPPVTLPPVTVPPLPQPTVPPIGGGGLPLCPPGTPLLPRPLDCLLRRG